MKKQITSPTQLIQAINEQGALTIYGPRALALARQAIEEVMEQTGHDITFDPTSAPDLVDYLTVTTVSGLEGAAIGAGLGALLGLLFKQPAAGAAIGASLGGAAGVGRGLQRVEKGWRVRAVRGLDGMPVVTVKAFGGA